MTVLFLMALTVWIAVVFVSTYTGPRAGDGFEYASVARNIARGQGAVIQNLTPAALGDRAAMTLPFVVHPPGWPYLIAAGFKLVGVRPWVPSALSAVGAWLLALVTFLWARRVSGQAAALLAGTLVAASPVVVASVSAGLSDGWFALLVASSIALLHTLDDRQRGLVVCAGMLLGASWWIRDATLLIAPIVVAWTFMARRSWRTSALAALGTAIPMALFVVRNLVTFGTLVNPHAGRVLAPSKALVPGLAAPFRYAHPLPTTVADALAVYASRASAAAQALLTTQIGAVGLVSVLGFAFYLAVRRDRGFDGDRTLWWMTLGLVALSWVLGVVGQSTERYFLPWLPAMALFSAAWLVGIVRALRSSRSRARNVVAPLALTFTVVLMVAIPAAQVIRVPRTTTAADYEALGDFIADRVDPGERIWSDHPSAVTWVADRTSIMMPALEQDFGPLTDTYKAGVIVLTSRTPQWDAGWVRDLWDGDQAPPGWRLVDRFSSSTLSARLYRRER